MTELELNELEVGDFVLNLWTERYHSGPKGVRKEVKSWRSTLNKISKRAKAENRRLKICCR